LEKQIMRTFPHIINIFVLLGSVFTLLILSACYPLIETPPAEQVLLVSPVSTDTPCEVCDQETIVASTAIEQDNLEDQALATAKAVGANAQATLNSVNATLNAAQAQKENDANIIAANIEATAKLARANAKATLVSAGSTQSAALTQDAIEQTQVQYDLNISEDLATENAIVMGTQNFLTANQNAAKTQSAVETSQWYTVEANQLQEERQRPITFLWTWCLPPFIVLIACLVLWGFWRWIKLQQAPLIKDQPGNSTPILKRGGSKNRLRVTNPEYLQVSRWLDAVKRTLLNSEEEDINDNTN
jgi:hypothetical protein